MKSDHYNHLPTKRMSSDQARSVFSWKWVMKHFDNVVIDEAPKPFAGKGKHWKDVDWRASA